MKVLPDSMYEAPRAVRLSGFRTARVECVKEQQGSASAAGVRSSNKSHEGGLGSEGSHRSVNQPSA